MRPSACAAKNGSRPSPIRLRTSEVMNTVLPARDSPVTPSRTEGVAKSVVNRPAERMVSVAGSMMSEKFTLRSPGLAREGNVRALSQ